MGVYIKGMEMPKDCIKCPFCGFEDGYWKCLVDGSHADFGGACRPSLCPLIPVPQHGRLIDADVMKTRINCDNDSLKRAYIDWIDAQETIIPASEEE